MYPTPQLRSLRPLVVVALVVASAACSDDASDGDAAATTAAVTAAPSATAAATTTRSPATTVAASAGDDAAGSSVPTTGMEMDEVAIGRIVGGVLTENKIPGAIVRISSPAGVYTRSFGVADKATDEAMASDLYMRIGSNTKTFVVTALLRFVDQGLIGLDDPIGTYLDGVPNGTSVTMRQLAEMRSGVPSYTSSEGFAEVLRGDPTRRWKPTELLPYAFSQPTLFEPDSYFNYSNTNTILIGLALEKVAGKPLPEIIRSEVIEPANLARTEFPDDGTWPGRHASGYSTQTLDGSEADATDWDPSWGWAAGAMVSTAEDLDAWVRQLAEGSLLSPATQQQRLDVVAIPENPDGFGYGLGLLKINGWVGHNGDLPGYSSVMYFHPESETSMIVIVNAETEVQVDTDRMIPPSAAVAEPLTQALFPDHPYRFPVIPDPPA